MASLTTQVCTPSNIRLWFGARKALNWGITILMFVPAFFVAMHVVHPFLAALICIAAAFILLFFVLEGRSIAIACPNPDCRKHVLVNTPWICGFKGCRNDNTDEFSFINRCQHCGAEPKAYQCHHCGKLIFFTEDHQETNYARCVNSPLVKDPHEDEVTKRRREIELAELDLKKAQVDVTLNSTHKALTPDKPKGVKERLRGKVGSKTELDDEVLRMKAEIDEQFKNDPAERERRHRIVDFEARDLLR